MFTLPVVSMFEGCLFYLQGRMATSDRVKKIVREEGRTARNLVLYHVPVQDSLQAGKCNDYSYVRLD